MLRRETKGTSCAALLDIANAETLSDDDTNN